MILQHRISGGNREDEISGQIPQQIPPTKMGFGEFAREQSADHCWNGKLSWFKVGGIANIAFFIPVVTGFLNSRKQ